jgi:hypothetical protein
MSRRSGSPYKLLDVFKQWELGSTQMFFKQKHLRRLGIGNWDC